MLALIGWALAAIKKIVFLCRSHQVSLQPLRVALLQSQSLQVNVSMELSGNETIKQAVMVVMGISFLSAHVFQVELAAGTLTVLDLQDMPKMLDWCLLHRRDAVPSDLGGAFRDFVLGDGVRVRVVGQNCHRRLFNGR